MESAAAAVVLESVASPAPRSSSAPSVARPSLLATRVSTTLNDDPLSSRKVKGPSPSTYAATAGLLPTSSNRTTVAVRVDLS